MTSSLASVAIIAVRTAPVGRALLGDADELQRRLLGGSPARGGAGLGDGGADAHGAARLRRRGRNANGLRSGCCGDGAAASRCRSRRGLRLHAAATPSVGAATLWPSLSARGGVRCSDSDAADENQATEQ